MNHEQIEQAAQSKLSEAENQTRLHHEEQRNRILSEARSEMKLQELRVESAGMALRESNQQIHSQRMELCQANQSYGHTRRESLVPYGIGGANMSCSRISYENSSRNERVENRGTFPTKVNLL